MKNARPLVCALCLLSGVAWAQTLEDFTYIAPLKLQTPGALYEAALTPEVYGAMDRRDMGDLRVFNSSNELVPYAIVRPVGLEQEVRSPVALPFFPLHGQRGSNAADLTIRVDKMSDGRLSTVVTSAEKEAAGSSVLGYLIDANAVKDEIGELRLRWTPAPEGTNTRVEVAISDDLTSWRNILSGAPLLYLRQGDALLERDSLKLHPVRTKYLRLSWSGQQAIALQGVEAVPVDALKEKARTWSAFKATAGDKSDEYVFELGAALPVDRLRLQVPQGNTVAPVSVFVRDQERENWRLLKSFVAYRLGAGENEVATPDIEVAASARYWLVRVDTRSGGLGGGMPVLHAGWLPHRVIFNARGAEPFRLALGNPSLGSAALAAQVVVPGYGTEKAYALSIAQIEAVQPNPDTAVERKLSQKMGLSKGADLKQIVLWSSLVLAVLLIGFMAWRLLRQVPKGAEKE